MQAEDTQKKGINAKTQRQPSIFIGHGSPMVAIEYDSYNEQLCQFVAKNSYPTAIVAISAHWITDDGIHITSSDFPEQIYDFKDYPETLYHLTYPCVGQPRLAEEISSLLKNRGFDVILDSKRGIDSGVWVPLYFAFPEVDIPVIQISMPKNATPSILIDIGKTLSQLRDKGILLIGSGNILNNKNLEDKDDKYKAPEDWVLEIDNWFKENLHELNIKSLQNYEKSAPNVEKGLIDKAHLLPLFFILGTMTQKDWIVDIFEGFHYGVMSMRTFAMVSPQ